MTELSAHSALANHVNAANPNASGYTSCFSAAVRDARLLAGRDQDAGKPTGPPVSKWGAGLLYMVLIDQIGTCFEPTVHLSNDPLPMLDHEKSRWIIAMAAFGRYVYPNLDRKTVYALYGLRNCLAHRYSLFNVPDENTVRNERRRKLLTHRFQLTWSQTAPLAKIATNRLDTKDRPILDTEVNLFEVCALCEDIVQTVQGLADEGTLTLKELTTEELGYQYGMYIR